MGRGKAGAGVSFYCGAAVVQAGRSFLALPGGGAAARRSRVLQNPGLPLAAVFIGAAGSPRAELFFILPRLLVRLASDALGLAIRTGARGRMRVAISQ